MAEEGVEHTSLAPTMAAEPASFHACRRRSDAAFPELLPWMPLALQILSALVEAGAMHWPPVKVMAEVLPGCLVVILS